MGITTSTVSSAVLNCFNEESCLPRSPLKKTEFSAVLESPSSHSSSTCDPIVGENTSVNKWSYFTQPRENPLNQVHSMVNKGKYRTITTCGITTLDSTVDNPASPIVAVAGVTLSPLRFNDFEIHENERDAHDHFENGSHTLTLILPHELGKLFDPSDTLHVSENEVDSIFVTIMSGDAYQLQYLLAKSKEMNSNKQIYQKNNSKEMVRFSELTWNKHPYCGCSVLHIAVLSCKVEMVQLVLELGAQICSKDKDGNTALALAYALGYVDMVDLITKHASQRFSTTPCSPCASSMLSALYNGSHASEDNVSIACRSVSSFDILSVRRRSSSFNSTLELSHTSPHHLVHKRANSMDWNIHMGDQRSPIMKGIAFDSFNALTAHDNDDHLRYDDANGIPPVAKNQRSSRHVAHDSGTISIPRSTASSCSEGFDSITASSISDLTTDSSVIKSKPSKRITKKIRKVASKALRFISK